MEYYVTIKAGGNTKWHFIHNAAKRKARRLLAKCKNVIEYCGIDHDKTEVIQEEPQICLFHCLFNINE